MRQSLGTHHGALLFVLIAIVLSIHTRVASSRPLQSPSAGTGALNTVQTQPSSHTEELIGAEDLRKLMAEEESCEDIRDDEECLKRRMIYEAHLDYIYTQSHDKP